MSSGRIDFISEYCDRWCERCAFTERCSLFAVKAAVAMCDGDCAAATELAVGRPKSVEDRNDEVPSWLEEALNVELTDAEIEETARQEEARRERVLEAPLSTLAVVVRTLSLGWLTQHHDDYATGSSPEIRDALETINWDVWLIGAKIHRALMGRDSSAHGDGFDDDVTQKDGNGSAKVALISIERSIAAWRSVARVGDDAEARCIALELESLRAELQHGFPDARAFRRPGFDD